MSAETPLMQQYREIKNKNMDSVLLFRLGDFYEMFFEDAKIASKELGITLTSRNKEKGVEVPLAGFPYHSASQYVAKLVGRGYKVAICEQVEDPKSAKGIVKREVIKKITPGTVVDTDYMDEKQNNYIMAVYATKEKTAIAYADITTGEFKCSEFDKSEEYQDLLSDIYRIYPKEIVVNESSYVFLNNLLENGILLNDTVINKSEAHVKDYNEFLKEYFEVVSLESYGIADKEAGVAASALLLSYILELHNYGEIPVKRVEYVNTKSYMELNLTTQKNLELISKNSLDKNSEGTLLWAVDFTKSAMGARLLKKIIKTPLLNIDEIVKRQEDVGYFIENLIEREEVKEQLKEIYDIERLIGKIIMGSENGRDLIALKNSAKASLEIKKTITGRNFFEFDMDSIIEIADIVEKAICSEPPFSVREGGMIRRGYSKELDDLHEISSNGKEYLLSLEQKERERTGIKSLKIKYNRVFGYYIEITNTNKELVPEDYIRKQTLANAERYITPELKEYETKILNAKDKIEALEYELFKEVSAKIRGFADILQKSADTISYIDVIISFAESAVKNNYVKPELNMGKTIKIVEGRHPVVEKLIGHNSFVNNDVHLNEEENFVILTGPNMAGKSTYMKQIAMIIIMAQIGCYVPAKSAEIGIIDKIFTRIGASDDIVSGQSTFMVEMSEVANIVNSATEKSFIILDEVGRGTSTFDGISIAWAISEYIHNKIGAKTIFATHYHELTEMEKRYKNAVNYRIEVKEKGDSVIFLRKIVRGGADKSYGIEVARLAGLPEEILRNSRKILKGLENKRAIVEKQIKAEQLSLFADLSLVEEEAEEEKEDICDTLYLELKEMDINNMTPLQAMMKLSELKEKAENLKL